MPKFDPNEILMSNDYGPFRVVAELGQDRTGHAIGCIEFINTGYRKETLFSNIRKGNVKDDTIDPIRDVSLFTQEQHDKFISYKILRMWHDMQKRCGNINHKEYYAYGGKGIKISNEWMIYSNFYNDCHFLNQYDKFYNDPYNYQLDKDFLQLNLPKEERVYSKETCMFLSFRDNTNLRAIENKQSGKDLTSIYYGVAKIKDKYYMGITANGHKISMYFDNEIAAANAYNYWFEKLHLYDLVRLHNDVPYMDIYEWTSHIISVRPMYHLI